MSTLRTYNVQSSDSASTNIQLTENGGIIVAGIITATGGIDITGGDVTLTNNLLIPEDKKIHLEGGSGDDYNAIWKADAENTVFVTSRFNMANIIDSNNDDTNSYWSIRKDGTTLSDSSELMRVQSNGSIGIGTDNPNYPFHVFDSGKNNIALFESGDAFASFGLSDSNGSVSFRTTLGKLEIRTGGDAGTVGTNSIESLVIKSTGEVGIGTDNPQQTLHVQDSSGRKIYPPPLFRARKSSGDAQTINNSTNTKITYTIEDVDTHGYYDTSNSRFTPTIPGWYFIEATVRCGQGSDGARFDMTLYIDGSSSIYAGGLNQQNTNDMGTGVATLVYLDGTQYVEVYVNQNTGSNCGVSFNSNAGGTNSINHFSAFLVSPD